MNEDAIRSAVAAQVSEGVVVVNPGDVELSILAEAPGLTVVQAKWSYEDMRESQPAVIDADGNVVLDRNQILDSIVTAWAGTDPPPDPVAQANVVARVLGGGPRGGIIASAEAAREVEESLATDRAAKPGVHLSIPIQPPLFVDGDLQFWLDHDYGPTRVTVRRGPDAEVSVTYEDAEKFVES
jgi:hypothetical protein